LDQIVIKLFILLFVKMMRPKSAGRLRIRPKGVPPLAIEGIVSRLHGSPERFPRMS